MSITVLGGSGVIPFATADAIDRAVVSIFVQYGWVITSERWIRNEVMDPRGGKTTWKYHARTPKTRAELARMVARYNEVVDRHPDWKLPKITEATFERP